MWGPGLVGVVVGVVVLGTLKDSPESVGFPSAEAMARGEGLESDEDDGDVAEEMHDIFGADTDVGAAPGAAGDALSPDSAGKTRERSPRRRRD